MTNFLNAEEITKYVEQKVFEEFLLTTSIPMRKDLIDKAKYIFHYMAEPPTTPLLSSRVKYRSSQGGLWSDDIAVYYVFLLLAGLKENEDFCFYVDFTEHWNLMYDDVNPKITKTLENASEYFRFEHLAMEILMQVRLKMANLKKERISQQRLDKAIKQIAEEHWRRTKLIEQQSKAAMEAAFERMIKGIPDEDRKKLLSSILEREEEKESRKFVQDILDRTKKVYKIIEH